MPQLRDGSWIRRCFKFGRKAKSQTLTGHRFRRGDGENTPNYLSPQFESLETRVMLSGTPLISDGLLAYWSFDEAEGPVVRDLSGNGFDVTLGGNARITSAGLDGGALDLSTDSDWATVRDPNDVTAFSDGATDQSFAVAMWVNNANYGYGTSRYLNSGVNGGGSDWGLGISGTFELRDKQGLEYPTNGIAATGPDVWTHVAGVFDSRNKMVRLYQDGLMVGERTVPSDFDLRDRCDYCDLSFGARTSSEGQSLVDDLYVGLIDEAYLFNRVLSDAEVHALSARDPEPWVRPGQSLSVSEKASVGEAVAVPEYVNPSGGPVNFSILDGNLGEAFTIDRATGQITVHNALDRETTASYTLMLQITDKTNNPAFGTTEPVTINVADVNEPVFMDFPQAFTVSDEAPNGTVIWRIDRRDPDDGLYPLTWSIDSGNTGQAFAIDPLGNVVVNDTRALDHTVQDTYQLHVTVDDGLNAPSGNMVTVKVQGARRLFFDEETLRPFAKTISVADYGAIPDDGLDDTAAIQAGLYVLAASSLDFNNPVRSLYVPAGEYLVSRKLELPNRSHHESLGVTIFGADPNTTILRWSGATGETMFEYGAWFSELSRLTLDGAGTAGVGLFVGFNFSTFNRISDMVFRNFQSYGLSMPGDPGQAETVVARCRFINNGQAGARISGFNDLDWWFWQNEFVDNAIGIDIAAGNAHAYENIFRGSIVADIRYSNQNSYAVRDNVSIGSNRFIEMGPWHTWPLTMTIQGNTIIDHRDPYAILLNSLGGYLLFDNVIQSPAGQTEGPILVRNWHWEGGPATANVLAAGNTFTVDDPYSLWRPELPAPITDLGYMVVQPHEIVKPYAYLPQVDFTMDRARVIEVIPGAGASVIQAAIDQAVAQYNGQRPIVHIQSGSYRLSETLVVPAGTDLRLIGDQGNSGDGHGTVLTYTGNDRDGAALKILGPTQVTVERISLSGGSFQSPDSKVGLLIENVDHPGDRIHFDQLGGQAFNHTFVSEGLVNALITHYNLNSNGNRVFGPRLNGNPGASASSLVDVFASASSRIRELSNPDRAVYEIDQGGRLYIRDTYYEGSHEQFLNLTGSGEFFIDGGKIGVYQTPSITPVVVDQFDGNVAMVNMSNWEETLVTPGAATSALLFGNIVNGLPGEVPDPSGWNVATTPGRVASLGNTFWGQGRTTSLPNEGLISDTAFLLEMLEPLRRSPPNVPTSDLANNPEGTNLRLLRVAVEGRDGVVIRNAQAPTISAIGDQTTNEDTPLGPISFTVNDPDTNVASLTVAVTSSDQTRIPNANIRIGGTGQNRTITLTPAANQNGGPVTISVTASDGTATTSEIFNVTINPINDAPVNQIPGTQSANENTALVFSATNGNAIALNDVDASGGLLEVSLRVNNGRLNVATLNGLTSVTGNGSANLTARGPLNAINAALDGLTYTPNVAFSGTDTFSIISNDLGNSGGGGPHRDVDTLSIVVNDSNRAPQITSARSVQVPENTTSIMTVTAVDPEGDQVMFSLDGGADLGAFGINSLSGALSFLSPKDFENPQDANADNVYEVQVQVDDGKGESTTQRLQVQVTNVTEGNPPTADIVDVSPNPRAGAVDHITIVFSQKVANFDLGDLRLTRRTNDTVSLLPGSATLTTTDNITWRLGNLRGLTGDSGVYELTLNADGTGIQDLAGNALAAGDTQKWINGAGDTNLNNEFDQFDVIAALQASKYLTGAAANWSQGDWNGDGVFDQFDIITAQQTQPPHYRQGPFAVFSRARKMHAQIDEPGSTASLRVSNDLDVLVLLFAAVGSTDG